MVLRYLDFYSIKGVGDGPRESLAGVTGCVLAKGTRIYMFKGWGSEGLLIY